LSLPITQASSLRNKHHKPLLPQSPETIGEERKRLESWLAAYGEPTYLKVKKINDPLEIGWRVMWRPTPTSYTVVFIFGRITEGAVYMGNGMGDKYELLNITK